jgi:hypothetical protein
MRLPLRRVGGVDKRNTSRVGSVIGDCADRRDKNAELHACVNLPTYFADMRTIATALGNGGGELHC